MKITNIISTTLPDTWFQAIDNCLEHGRKWKITQGSYVGQYRYELDYVTIHIKDPGARPLIPEMPPGLTHLPPPVTQEYLDNYLTYLLTDYKEENTLYTYGERLVPQMEKIIERFKINGGGSNQECISISQPSDINLEDSPCLRSIDCRIYKDECLNGEEKALHFFLTFRSWDAALGLPANLAGLRLVQEFMSDAIGVKPGEIIASSKGLHVYDHTVPFVKMRTARKEIQNG
jgi:thymidylate synthase